MSPDPDFLISCEKAMQSKDLFFDGRFFIGVRTTGIFCRSVCPARSPKRSNIDFYKSAAHALDAGLRPCFRCRPECAPEDFQNAPAIVFRALKLMDEHFEENCRSNTLAQKLGVSERHLQDLFIMHMGADMSSVIHSKRLLFAKKLLTETHLSLDDVALAAGYKSTRSFYSHIKKHYSHPPSQLRKHKTDKNKKIVLLLPFHAPFNWKNMTAFLKLRAIPGVESVSHDTYSRSIETAGTQGIISISLDKTKNRLVLEIDSPDKKKLFHIVRKVKCLFDLNAPSMYIDDILKRDKTLSQLVKDTAGIRVPGCFNNFELSIRAIIGQQISVKGATTIIGRIAQKYGLRLKSENRFGLKYIFPGPELLSRAAFNSIGLTQRRIETIHQFSDAVHQKEIEFNSWSDPDELRKSLIKIKGIGDWTAHYISMRTIKDPDAFPLADLGLLKAVSFNEPLAAKKTLKSLSEQWKPYRAYAAMYLWSSL